MTLPNLSGQNLLDSLRIRMGGLSNAFTTDQYFSFLNEGKDEVWAIVRSLELDYFADSSQPTDNTKDDFFLQLSTTVREYDLPTNLREVRFIECTTQDFQDREFTYRDISHPDFKRIRRESDALGSNSGVNAFTDHYIYTIFGTQLILAQFPEANLNITIWYIKAIDDISVDDFPEILFPFNKKIVDYAAKKATLAAQNLEMEAAWKDDWAESIRLLAISAGQRQAADPQFIADYFGYSEN